MADKAALDLGKRMFKKKLSGTKIKVPEKKMSGPRAQHKGEDHYHYRYKDSRGKVKEKKKDLEYYTEILHFSHEDAKVCLTVNKWAKSIDGWKIGKWRFGWSTPIGVFIPLGGDAIDLLLALALIRQAKKLPGGLNPVTQSKMGSNAFMDAAIGFTPAIGGIIDGFWQGNTRNAALLEEWIDDGGKHGCAQYRASKTETAMKKAEKAGKASRASSRNRAVSRDRAQTDRYLEAGPAPRIQQQAQTNGQYNHELVTQRRDRAQVNGYGESDRAPALPPRGIDEQYGSVHERLGKREERPANVAKPSRGGRSLFSGREHGKGDEMATEMNGSRGREMTQPEHLAPARPQRADTTGQQNIGHF